MKIDQYFSSGEDGGAGTDDDDYKETRPENTRLASEGETVDLM